MRHYNHKYRIVDTQSGNYLYFIQGVGNAWDAEKYTEFLTRDCAVRHISQWKLDLSLLNIVAFESKSAPKMKGVK